MASNQIAWLEGARKPVTLKDTEIHKAGPDDIVVKNHAVAINPVDWKLQDGYLESILPFPIAPGEDLAGEVLDVGANVTNFSKGDRVLAHSIALANKKSEYSAFQNYSIVSAQAAAKIPADLSYAQASVLPLAISTAAAGLFQSEHLGLPYPVLSPSDSGKIILIWGGASSVGAVAIQLAKAAGVTVVTTASGRNTQFVKSLGAEHVFDYNNKSVVGDIVSTISSSGKDFAGVYDAISTPDTLKHVGAVFEKVGKGSKKLATTLPPQGLPADVEAKSVFAAVIFFNPVGKAVWGDFVPQALERGTLKAVPEAQVEGKGLQSLQKAFDVQKAGVSAKKIVVEL